MAEKSRAVELKVGIFVFSGLIILTYFVLLIGDFKLVRPGYHIQVVFGFANGVKVGAPLRLAGVSKGEVKKIAISHDDETGKTRVLMKAWVDGDAPIPADSRVWVNTLGLLGEKYLEIIPGTDYHNTIDEDDILVGEDPTSMQEVTDLVKDIALETRGTLEDAQKTMQTLTAILEDMHEGRGTVGKLFTDDTLYNNLEEMFADLKKHPWKLLYRPKQN